MNLNDKMAQDHERYMARKRLQDDAARALEALLAVDISPRRREMVGTLADLLREDSAHIVRVWD